MTLGPTSNCGFGRGAKERSGSRKSSNGSSATSGGGVGAGWRLAAGAGTWMRVNVSASRVAGTIASRPTASDTADRPTSASIRGIAIRRARFTRARRTMARPDWPGAWGTFGNAPPPRVAVGLRAWEAALQAGVGSITHGQSMWMRKPPRVELARPRPAAHRPVGRDHGPRSGDYTRWRWICTSWARLPRLPNGRRWT